MATTLFQKLRLFFRGWSRRREDAQQEFLRRNLQWGNAQGAPPAAAAKTPAGAAIDRDGLHVAYLEDSGQIAWYLDTETGDVVDVRDGRTLGEPRYRRVPQRTAASEAEDRRAFVASLEDAALRSRLATASDAAEFRQILSSDRALERAWYNFKNDRAIAAIDAWLASIK